MFSGIVEEAGKVVAIEKDQENVDFTLTCSFADDSKLTKVYRTTGFA
jgi:riboflavin synthase